MKQTKHVDNNLGLQGVGCALMVIGFVALFWFPIGTLLGIPLMIGSVSMGNRKLKVWKCQDCGYFFERG